MPRLHEGKTQIFEFWLLIYRQPLFLITENKKFQKTLAKVELSDIAGYYV